jgi:hypothetical protein
MRHRLEPRQPKEAAGALDGVDQTEDIAEKTGIVGILFELDQLEVEHRQALVCLGQKFAEKVIH